MVEMLLPTTMLLMMMIVLVLMMIVLVSTAMIISTRSPMMLRNADAMISSLVTCEALVGRANCRQRARQMVPGVRRRKTTSIISNFSIGIQI